MEATPPRPASASRVEWDHRPGEHEAQRTGDHQAGQNRRLRPELKRGWAEEQHRQNGHHDAERDPRDWTIGHRPGIGDHEQYEHENFGRGHQDRPEIPSTQRCHMPAGDHAMVRHGSQRQRRQPRKRCHEPQLEAEETQLPRDQQPADDQDRIGHDQPWAHRDPPQILGLRETRAQRDKRDDQAEV